ncbi:predicted protein [Histoplasma capsulatum G186AR]|uniref:Uncharacterized protein n=1 Tax=Ajellomyces capsulatus (strain G186AR / H82 / ATCC MYA-2454 / RMSCC 2432) TaxID=447093 RepID=C0P0I9_AJECG|nr:uncharacterized protein HCBG_08919 [Histoplasma capsulatum G186AR]EEH02809.1 predicted protein [Histoplasma capsulatum G186AR]
MGQFSSPPSYEPIKLEMHPKPLCSPSQDSMDDARFATSQNATIGLDPATKTARRGIAGEAKEALAAHRRTVSHSPRISDQISCLKKREVHIEWPSLRWLDVKNQPLLHTDPGSQGLGTQHIHGAFSVVSYGPSMLADIVDGAKRSVISLAKCPSGRCQKSRRQKRRKMEWALPNTSRQRKNDFRRALG